MAMDVGGDDSGLNSEINVTPLVDVVLVLLIIFMVIVPLTMRGFDMDIPRPSTAPATAADAERPEQIVLGIDYTTCPATTPMQQDGLPAGCQVDLNGRYLPVEDLAGQVAATFENRADEDRVLFLRAQDRLNYEAVMRIVDSAKSGVDGLRIGMVTGRLEPLPAPGPKPTVSGTGGATALPSSFV